jgi:hypothetical protein
MQSLGKGGMAAVWSVRDEVTGHNLALKRLAKGAAAGHVALFEREYHTLATLNHPSIVKAYDYAADADGPFYTMELLVGSDVSQRAPLPCDEVCRILRDVASAIALLHARRLIHRDLSARNVWLTPEGHVKLIDFGTLAAFGKPPDVAGTPPFIAPESLHRSDLDQRTDLFGLGALGYYLLSGRHAYLARSLLELPDVWRERPRLVSKRVAELGRADLSEVPPALDALIEALLSQDPLARPTTSGDVIDRLTLIASLPQGEEHHVAESYLSNPAFVGRIVEREAFSAALRNAAAGKASALLVEGAAGLGRTRLLDEFALEARLNGAIVLQVESNADRATLAVAEKYALALLGALPVAALQAAAPYAATLGHVSAALRERLGVETLAKMPEAHGEARMRVQAALRDWFLDVARTQRLVILADDFQLFDDGSAAWLTALTLAASDRKLVVVAAVQSDAGTLGLTIHALRQHARKLALAPLTSGETAELFRSVFGDVQHLARLVDLVQQRTEGNPGHAMDLAEHLRREGTVALSKGEWVLPQTIAPSALPANRLDAEIARLARLPAAARELGQALSVREGTLPLDMCTTLAEIEPHGLFKALEALVREGVLIGSAEGYRFARESLRKQLLAELEGERRKLAHRQLGRYLLRSPGNSQLDRLKGGVHLLLGGDEADGSRAVCAAGKYYALVELADLGPAAPSLERALEHFRAAGYAPHELIGLLAPLALAGYYADRRLAVRYGREAVELLQDVVGLKRARGLQRFLGRKLGLLVAMALAALVFARKRKNACVPKYRETLMMLFNCVAALTGVCTICIDPEGGRAYASVLEPMTALGPDHVATFMHQFCLNLVATVEDKPGVARDNWRKMIERLDRPNAVRDLPANVHSLYLAGALYARGVGECWRDDSQALECAQRLQDLRLKLYEMSADQVRMVYYGNRGDLEKFKEYRQRVELHAIARGTAWQVETWTYSGLITVYARTGDVAGLKECVEQLKRLSVEMPSLRYAYSRALGGYLVLRGSPSDALDVIGQGEAPGRVLGWARGEGLRARAFNALGEYARAKEACSVALAKLTSEDRKFTALNLGVEIQLARAEAGLGDLAGAEQQLQGLLDTHAPGGNPLSLGALAEALAELAALRGDEVAFGARVEEVARYFRGSGDPALVARHERLARMRSAVCGPPVEDNADRQDSSRPPGMMTVVHRLRHGGDHTVSGSAEWTLKQLSDLTASSDGFLFLREGAQLVCAARLGSSGDEDTVARWVAQCLSALNDDDLEATRVTDSESTLAPNRLKVDSRRYRLSVLRSASDASDNVLGAIVLSGSADIPVAVMRVVAERIVSSADNASS